MSIVCEKNINVNTNQIIDKDNKRILTSSQANDAATTATTEVNKTCNCRQKNACLLAGNCLQSTVIYTIQYNTIQTLLRLLYKGLSEDWGELQVIRKKFPSSVF